MNFCRPRNFSSSCWAILAWTVRFPSARQVDPQTSSLSWFLACQKVAAIAIQNGESGGVFFLKCETNNNNRTNWVPYGVCQKKSSSDPSISTVLYPKWAKPLNPESSDVACQDETPRWISISGDILGMWISCGEWIHTRILSKGPKNSSFWFVCFAYTWFLHHVQTTCVYNAVCCLCYTFWSENDRCSHKWYRAA